MEYDLSEKTKGSSMEAKKITVYEMCVTALMTALTCILAPMSIPIGPIPISFTMFVLYISAFLLGPKLSSISYIVYLLLGVAGLPIFSGYTGGLAKLAGPTGGYLVGNIFLTLIIGFTVEHFYSKWYVIFLSMLAANIVLYFFGTVWFVIQANTDMVSALKVCVFPFLLGDLIKVILAMIIGYTVRKSLVKANLIKISKDRK